MSSDPGAGWRPLSKPSRPSDFGQSPFSRLAIAHVLAMAGDALVTMALAGSLFFSISPQAARGKVALYLVLTMAPFALVAPFLGPILDRTPGGRRLMFIGASLSRSLICLSMATNLQGFWLFPQAFGVLVLSKAHMVTKSALVPATVPDEKELVTANSRLAVLSVIAGFVAAVPGVVLLNVGFLGGPWVVRLAAVSFAAAAIAAVRVRKPRSAEEGSGGTIAEKELHAITIRMAATSMGVLRGSVGFMAFFVAFAFRSQGAPSWWYGLVLVCSLGGTLVGNVAGPHIRRLVVEERMLLGGLALVSIAAVLAARAGGLPALCLIAASTGVAAAVGKLAFDSIVQRDAPDAVRGHTFARFETRFQLVWVAAAFVPVVLSISESTGILMIALGTALAFFSYLGGIASARHRGEHFSARLQPPEAGEL